MFISGAVVILFLSVILFGSGKLFRQTKSYVLTFREPVTGLQSGSLVKLMGVNIGDVKEIWLGVNAEGDRELVNVVIELDRKRLRDLFREDADAMDDRPRFDTQVSEKGLRGRLSVLSMVSGTLYIELGLFPGTTGFQLDAEDEHGHWEIPTIPSTKMQMMESLITSLENLTKFDFGGTSTELRALLTDLRQSLEDLQFEKVGEGLVDTIDKADALLGDPALKSAVSNLNQTLGHVEELAGKLNKEANPLLASAADDLNKAGIALDEATEALTALKSQLAPNSTLSRELITTLDQAGQALEALRELAQQIQRDPSSLITGKPAPTTTP
jgi:paraquat-inducible protein B